MVVNSPKHSVMIIDDNDVDRMMAKRLTSRSGLVDRFVGFSSAIEALAYLADDAHAPFDLILVDQQMPNMNGTGFLRNAAARLSSKLQHTDIIMMSTLFSEADRTEAESFALVKGFITKPLSTDKLATLLSGAYAQA